MVMLYPQHSQIDVIQVILCLEGATDSWEDLADGVLPLLCCVQGTDPSVMLVMLLAEMFPEPEGGQVSFPSVWIGCTLCLFLRSR